MKLSDRMKQYEHSADIMLPARLPVIIRLDGNSFSKLTKRGDFKKPYDGRFAKAMKSAAKSVLKYCSGAQLAYVQSDEISLLLRNNQNVNTEPFLGNRIQKLTSLLAAKVSVAFNKRLLEDNIDTEAVFDCRAFIVPEHEVHNYFLWRQLDCFKNFVSSYAYWNLKGKYGRKTAQNMLHGLSTDQRQELIYNEFGVNVNDISDHKRRGQIIRKVSKEVPIREIMTETKYENLLEKGHIDEGDTVEKSEWESMGITPRLDKDDEFIKEFLK